MRLLWISQAQSLRSGSLPLTIRAAVGGCLEGKEERKGLPQAHPPGPFSLPAPALAALTSLALPIGIRLWLSKNGKDLILQGVGDTEQPFLEGSIEGRPHCA